MADQSVAVPQKQSFKEKASHEFRRFLVIFFYLWVVFGLLSLHKSIVLSQHHVDVEEHTFAVINAFVFAKVLLVGEQLKFGSRFAKKPLLYPILYKCFVFSLVLIGFHIVESVAVGLWHGNTLAASWPPLLGWNPRGLFAVGVMCFVLLLPFFGFREIARVIGRAEMRALLLEPRSHDPKLI
jgi:cell division protein FtsW (lipid II flippase)